MSVWEYAGTLYPGETRTIRFVVDEIMTTFSYRPKHSTASVKLISFLVGNGQNEARATFTNTSKYRRKIKCQIFGFPDLKKGVKVSFIPGFPWEKTTLVAEFPPNDHRDMPMGTKVRP